jgi:hypothetical protein
VRLSKLPLIVDYIYLSVVNARFSICPSVAQGPSDACPKHDLARQINQNKYKFSARMIEKSCSRYYIYVLNAFSCRFIFYFDLFIAVLVNVSF